MGTTGQRQGGLAAGIVLIFVGIALLLINFDVLAGEFFLVALGGAFLVVFAIWRRLGFLIPGMILVWLGAGITLFESGVLGLESDAAVVQIALGLAFVSIYVFMGANRHWWPLIPGSILIIIGTLIFLTTENIIDLTLDDIFNLIVPVIIIIVGVWLIVRQYLKRGRTE